jgi:hypothetical protein
VIRTSSGAGEEAGREKKKEEGMEIIQQHYSV